MLILVGSGVIVFEAIRRLIDGAEVEHARLRHRGRRASRSSPTSSSRPYLRAGARATESPALEGDAAHLRTDALTSLGVLVGLALVQITGARLARPGRSRCVVAAAIVVTGVRLAHALLARARRRGAARADERAAIRDGGRRLRRAAASSATTSCARAAAGARRYVDLHVQFRAGTTLEDAHATAHELQDAIAARARAAPTC